MSRPMVIEIQSTKVDDRNGVKAETGKAWRIRNQRAYAHVGDAYPIPFDVSLEGDREPYAAGHYTLDQSSFEQGKFGIQLRRYLVLVPVQGAAAKAAA